jgi:hypothetical protein
MGAGRGNYFFVLINGLSGARQGIPWKENTWTVARASRCSECRRLLLTVVEEGAGKCLECQGVTALQVPGGEANVTVETKEFSGEESKEDRRRRLTRERVQRYRKARR